MRSAHRAGRTITLRLRFGDFTRVTRSRSLLKATMQTSAVLTTARQLLAEARPLIDLRGLTLVGVAVGNLDSDGAVQLELPFDVAVEDSLDTALDAVRDRFGSSSVTRAASLGRDLHPSVPILPD
jgi:DNA polymerase-4